MLTVIHEQRETTLPSIDVDADSLWLNSQTIERTTGWSWKPQGLCQADTCIPLPRDGHLVRDGRLDVAGMWAYMGAPVVHDQARTTWVLGSGASQRSQLVPGTPAPDFELPDLSGRMHRLSGLQGSKVLLTTWASW